MKMKKIGLAVGISLLVLLALSPAAATNYIVVGTQNPDATGLVRDLVGSIKIANNIPAPVVGIADIDVTNSMKNSAANLLIVIGGFNANSITEELRSMGEINDAMVDSSPGQSWNIGTPWGGAIVWTISGSTRSDTTQAIDAFIANGCAPLNTV